MSLVCCAVSKLFFPCWPELIVLLPWTNQLLAFTSLSSLYLSSTSYVRRELYSCCLLLCVVYGFSAEECHYLYVPRTTEHAASTEIPVTERVEKVKSECNITLVSQGQQTALEPRRLISDQHRLEISRHPSASLARRKNSNAVTEYLIHTASQQRRYRQPIR